MSKVSNHGNDEYNGFFDELNDLVSVGFDSTSRKLDSNYPRVDILEENQSFHLIADLPGLDRKDLEIIVQGDVLTISGEKKQSRFTGNKLYSHFERNYGYFNRSFNLPSNINSESIEAYYKDGVLDIFIAKNKTKPTDAIIIE